MRLLIIEDDDRMIDCFGRSLSLLRVETTFARTLAEAETVFSSKKFDAIAVDGCLNSHGVNTLDLVRFMRQRFNGPIVAISTVADYNKLLMEAGCNLSCLKSSFPFALRKELSL